MDRDKDPEHRFPWNFLMNFFVFQMRLSPSDFWRLTVPEISALISSHSSQEDGDDESINRQGLDALMRKFPDGV